MNPTRRYEAIFIFPPEEGPEAWKEGEKRLEETLRRFGGRTLQRDDWGRRPLGYAIQKVREGRMLLWHFEMEASQVAGFRKALELDEKILKSMIVKVKEPKPVGESEKGSRPSEQAVRQGEEEVHGRKP